MYETGKHMQKSKLNIEIRSGEYTRCKGNYCSVAEFCNQYKGDGNAKKKTQELMKTLEKKKAERARTKKGRFVADDPSTPQNEAYVPKNLRHMKIIREATAKATRKIIL